MVAKDFSVLVFDMAHAGEPDAEHLVSGFGSVEAARAYGEASVRASVEELRQPGQSPEELRYIYGEDCAVLGDAWKGREQIDFYIAIPARPAECDWPALTPRLKRFHATLLISDGTRASVWAGRLSQALHATVTRGTARHLPAGCDRRFRAQGHRQRRTGLGSCLASVRAARSA